MIIRPAISSDADGIWSVIGNAVRDGEVFALDRNMSEAAAVAHWMGSEKETFVAIDDGGSVLGTYYIQANQKGGGGHVANAGYATAQAASGRGIARAMCAHSLEQARTRGFTAMQFNFVVSTNVRAIKLWESMGFDVVGRLPGAFNHPHQGYVDALVMWQAL
jgi:ribosomal protein S18 acetylase RimI-like enzyme